MSRSDINDLLAFLAIARAHSFTKAAATLGISQSALSHTLRGLESRLGLRLLNRTTRSVSTTEAGERLLQRIGPHFEEINAELAALSELRDKPSGTLRISATDQVADAILLPKLKPFLADYPDVRIEIAAGMRLVDIVAQGFDAGVRAGEQIAKDMIAVPIGPNLRMAVVGAPTYFARRPAPKKPQDLTAHNCINLRLPTRGGLYAWEFEKRRRVLNVHVDGQLTVNNASQLLHAALAGSGLACVAEDAARPFMNDGRLIRVLGDWCPPFPGYHLYYTNRRQPSPAFTLLVDALRYRG